MLDGDGYCLRIEFLAGGTTGAGGTGSRVKFTSRFIRTEEFKAEVGHVRYRSPRHQIPLDIFPLKSRAETVDDAAGNMFVSVGTYRSPRHQIQMDVSPQNTKTECR
jgi:hypothetical protein